MRIVAADADGRTTGVAQIDPETHVWVQTNPTAAIGRDDVVPPSVISAQITAPIGQTDESLIEKNPEVPDTGEETST